MTITGEFSAKIIETLARRAAMLCSNPDCTAITSGPTDEPSGTVNVGEAAHIYGRTVASARYNSSLSMAELADITNGIWLCRNCHKLVDNDPARFPSEMLFRWRRHHELSLMARLGKTDQIRESLRNEKLRGFDDVSYLAQQIILDRPIYWEYKLTVELLRTQLGHVHDRLQFLKRGMYARENMLVAAEDMQEWLSAKLADVSNFISAFKPLLEELNKSWGPPGMPGDERQILTVCSLIVAAAENILKWEESVRFTHVPAQFQEVLEILQDVAGNQLEEIFRIPRELSVVFSTDNPTGLHVLDLVFALPPDFAIRYQTALRRAMEG